MFLQQASYTPSFGGLGLSYRNSLDRFLADQTHLYAFLRRLYVDRKLRVGPEGRIPAGQRSSQINASALKQYRVNVEMFVDLARNIGAVPVLIIQARLVVPDNTEAQRARIQYDYVRLDHQGLVNAYERTDEVMRDVAARKEVAVIDASRDLTGKDEMLQDHVHLTDQGAEELARVVSRGLADLLKARQ